ncbi:hypothetical protein [Streptomyces sp. NPDC002156]
MRSGPELLSAREAYGAAVGLAGWAVLYLLLGAWWWPALSAAAVVAATAWIRGRSATAVFADLVEATVDLHAITLAQELGLTGERPTLTREVGDAITTTLALGMGSGRRFPERLGGLSHHA